MDITFNIPHVFYPGSSRDDNADALRALLDCLIRLNQVFIRRHAPLGLYHSRVVYGRTEVWDTIPALYDRGYGDCKSLTAALIAEYRMKGIECSPVFRWIDSPRGDGAVLYHILVMKYGAGGNIEFEDPSKRLGMRANENAYFRGY
jgi:hypothetical protein